MTTPEMTNNTSQTLDDLSTEDFLLVVGQRVRQQRARKSMSRRRLAEVSQVSERYLAQLESGQGNMSIALLRKVTAAIGISMESLMSGDVVETCVRKPTVPSSSNDGLQQPATHPTAGVVSTVPPAVTVRPNTIEPAVQPERSVSTDSTDSKPAELA